MQKRKAKMFFKVARKYMFDNHPKEETMGLGPNMRQRGEQQGENRSGEAIED